MLCHSKGTKNALFYLDYHIVKAIAEYYGLLHRAYQFLLKINFVPINIILISIPAGNSRPIMPITGWKMT